ncbi:uncharacterized protein KY384_008782 [Bacidia gigantensis]|uniref:uncharacterized protein n=1 Tax=Bacidia gigantensis TaxID=2732470 RepID=UPI001D04C4BF|nr:uncharacterized protein KY384_008782 [Bacidia gigantensis]KAG8526581.1 hypothetical protein KY384_008782 [Bacidia gigantensis]
MQKDLHFQAIKRPTPSKYSMRAHPRAAEILAERKKAAENEALGNGLNNHLTIQATIEGPLEPPSRYRRRKIPLPTYFPPTSEELRELAAHPDWDPTTPSDSVAKPRALSPLSSSSKKGGEDQGKKDEEGKKGTKNYGKEKAGQGEGKDGKEGQVKKKGQGRDCIREAQACLAAYRREW